MQHGDAMFSAREHDGERPVLEGIALGVGGKPSGEPAEEVVERRVGGLARAPGSKRFVRRLDSVKPRTKPAYDDA